MKIIHLALMAGISLLSLPLHAGVTETTGTTAALKVEAKNRILWGAKVSPYVRKVLVTLEEKKIPYELREILPLKFNKEAPADFIKIDPQGKIPAYSETNNNEIFSISDSDVIMNYLDQTVSENPLRPLDAQSNARVSQMIKYADDTIAPLTHSVLMEKVVKVKVLNAKSDDLKVAQILEQDLPKIFSFLENKLSDGRNWIAGTDNFSLADIAVGSHLATLITSGFDFDQLLSTNYPKLKIYSQKIMNRDSFKKALS